MLCRARYCVPQIGEVEKGENRKCCYELNEGEGVTIRECFNHMKWNNTFLNYHLL